MYKISGILYRHNNPFQIDWKIEETLPTLCSKLKYVAHFCIKHGSNLAPKLKKIISISYVCTKNFMCSLFRRKMILTRSLPQRFGVIYAVSCYKLSVCLCQKKKSLNSHLSDGVVVAEPFIWKLIELHSNHGISSFIVLYAAEKCLLFCCSVFIFIVFQTRNVSLSKNVLVGNRERQVKGQISWKLVKPHNLNFNRNHIIWPEINNLRIVV